MRVLVTGGGCEEPIDGVRSICNFSTGATASFLCDRFRAAGHDVLAVMAERSVHPSCEAQTFRSCSDLAALTERLLAAQSFDLVIHAAAVSDYRPVRVEINGDSFSCPSVPKIESGASVAVFLAENQKIIDRIAGWSRNPACEIVGFKLVNGASAPEGERAALDLLAQSGVGLVILNDKARIEGNSHPTRCYSRGPDGSIECVFRGKSKVDLADFLVGRYANTKELRRCF